MPNYFECKISENTEYMADLPWRFTFNTLFWYNRGLVVWYPCHYVILMEKAGKGMVCSQSCHIYPHTRSHFYTFRFALVTDVESRPPDDDVVGNKIARRTAFIHRAAYLRHIFGVLWSYVSYTFRIRFDLLSVILLFGDFGRRRLKLQLYLSVECCKFGLQLFQFVLLLPYLPGYLLQLWDLLFLHLVLRLVLVNDGRNPLLCVQEIACGGYRVSHRQHAAYVIQGYWYYGRTCRACDRTGQANCAFGSRWLRTIQCEICHEGLSQLREQKVPHIDSDFACYRWKQRQYARGGRAIQKNKGLYTESVDEKDDRE